MHLYWTEQFISVQCSAYDNYAVTFATAESELSYCVLNYYLKAETEAGSRLYTCINFGTGRWIKKYSNIFAIRERSCPCVCSATCMWSCGCAGIGRPIN